MILALWSPIWPCAGGRAGAEAGVVLGTVRYSGRAESRNIWVTRDREICHVEGATDGSILTNDPGGLAGVVVSLRGASARPVSLDSPGVDIHLAHCGFQPRVSSLTLGARLTIRSMDSVLHQPKAVIGDREVFRWKMPLPQRLSKRMRNAGFVEVRCQRHAWSRAWVWVFEHPHHAVTDAAGGYRLTDVPPGTYTVVFWHERFSEVTRAVDVAAGATARVDAKLGG